MKNTRSGVRYHIGVIIAKHLIEKEPCELPQAQILKELEADFGLKISRSTVCNHIAALKRNGYIDSHVQGGHPRTTVYKMTDKLLAFFEKEHRYFSDIESISFPDDDSDKSVDKGADYDGN
jgi:DNA-binding transcriptional ArsR family regulator